MIFKNLTFDGISLKEYGVYISGEAVFDSPTRDVEMVTIPGRNGSFALDKGRFNNITVTYPAGIYATSQTEFAEKVSTLRNLLASRKGYCRLTDEYNPDEFRLGVYKAGLELDPTHYNEAGRFELSFDCKPQRFLFSGEEVFTLGEWGETETYSGSIASFEGDETTAIKSLTAQIVPKQSGSGDPSPSNVRPISGYSEVKTTRCGKNLFDKSAMVKMWYMDSNGKLLYDGTTILFSVPIGTEFILSGTNGNRNRLCYIDKPLSEVAINDVTTFISNTNLPIHLTSQHQTYVYYMNSSQNASLGDSLQLELGSTVTDYEPYNGTTYTTSLGQTVYGGTLEVMSGELVSDMATPIDLGSLEWRRDSNSGTYYFYATLSTPCAYAYNTPESQLKVTALPYTYKGTGGWAYMGNKTYGFTYNTIRIRDDSYTDPTSFKASLTNVTFSYGVATPTTIQLTPTQVTTLLGNNNIWADSGDVTVEIGQNPNVLVNPTLFEACPLIEFNASGSGSINLGSKKMEFFNSPLGTINLPFTVSTTEASADTSDYVEFSGSYNTGDKFRVKGSKATFNLTAPSTITSVSFPTGMDLAFRPNESSFSGTNALTTVEDWQETEFTIGTSSTVTKTYTPSYSFGGSSHTATFTLQLIYDGDTTIRMKWTATLPSGMTLNRIAATNSKYTLVCDSTANSLTGDLYIDLDIGEAYKVEDDSITSINNFVNLGGELPTLDPGATEISTDDSISNVKVTPRWWKV